MAVRKKYSKEMQFIKIIFLSLQRYTKRYTNYYLIPIKNDGNKMQII